MSAGTGMSTVSTPENVAATSKSTTYFATRIPNRSIGPFQGRTRAGRIPAMNTLPIPAGTIGGSPPNPHALNCDSGRKPFRQGGSDSGITPDEKCPGLDTFGFQRGGFAEVRSMPRRPGCREKGLKTPRFGGIPVQGLSQGLSLKTVGTAEQRCELGYRAKPLMIK